MATDDLMNDLQAIEEKINEISEKVNRLLNDTEMLRIKGSITDLELEVGGRVTQTVVSQLQILEKIVLHSEDPMRYASLFRRSMVDTGEFVAAQSLRLKALRAKIEELTLQARESATQPEPGVPEEPGGSLVADSEEGT